MKPIVVDDPRERFLDATHALDIALEQNGTVDDGNLQRKAAQVDARLLLEPGANVPDFRL